MNRHRIIRVNADHNGLHLFFQIVDYDDEKTLLIEPPTKIILLGDILDIWDPKDQDRNNVIKDAVEPFSILHDIDCEKIYVTGNHDEDIEEIEKKIKSFEWKKGHNLIFSRRHYPEEKKIFRGNDVNGLHYSFLHGHQYDKEQITFKLSEILNRRFDPVDFVQDLANTSLSKVISIYMAKLFFFLFLLLLFINSFGNIDLIKGVTFNIKDSLGLIFVSLTCYLAGKIYKSSKKFEADRNEQPEFSRIFGFILIVLFVSIIAGITSIVIPLLQNIHPELNDFLDNNSQINNFYHADILSQISQDSK